MAIAGESRGGCPAEPPHALQCAWPEESALVGFIFNYYFFEGGVCAFLGEEGRGFIFNIYIF